MSQIKRRHFLQAAGSTLAAIGLSQLDFLRQANQYGRVLASGTPRKLALLVGINSYKGAARDLQGCVTDVELQRELLIHRFGFNPRDIVAVWENAETPDLQPTRANILRTFQEHLIAQAKPGDVVVFHFSGHGSLVNDPSPLDSKECRANKNCHLNGTMVPNDPIERRDESTLIVPDIMGRSLFLLVQALETENVTVVLDSCHSGAATRGNTVVRSAQRTSRNKSAIPQAAEIELQKALISKLGLETTFEQRRQLGIAKGIALGSARRNQEALDCAFDGFSAGAFTYLLTRYLWQLPGTEAASKTYINLARSTRSLGERQRHNQEPIIEYQPNRNYEEQPVYFATPVNPAAEAVITNIQNGQIEFWLGGVSAQNITSTNTVFTVLNPSGQMLVTPNGKPVEVQQQERLGLVGRGNAIAGDVGQLREGMLLRERIVGIPTNPMLTIRLDNSLGDGLDQARSTLQGALIAGNINRIQTAPVGKAPLDCILGRMTEAYQQQLTEAEETDLPPLNTIGLFTTSLSPLRFSFGRINESATAAANRLKPQFRLLLVGKVLESIASTTSELQVVGEIFSASGVGSPVPLASRGAENQRSILQSIVLGAEPFASGDAIQIKVENQEDRKLYLSCLAIDAFNNLIVLYPADFESPEDASQIDAGGSLIVPRPQDELKFALSGSGQIQLLTLVSTQPLRNVLRGLKTIARRRGL
ncbi:caspase family protein [Microseira wollei]|uniref:Peptidase C14, caspase catalytic subunit p20 n=1 Tax=Microseira wollei NIES-4236 TaxID=2530354 RepID=A0AAV3XEQ8_9CYAN|nr:caspase family protein [Microseira wollei]GET38924.1 peptidase C14, caspase catalytic subunit p20 [Microseira wollei NIES-4236]